MKSVLVMTGPEDVIDNVGGGWCVPSYNKTYRLTWLRRD